MTIAFRLVRALHLVSLCLVLCALPVAAQQSQRGDNEMGATAQDFDNESDDDGRSFEHELADIEAQYSQLAPDHAKSATPKDVTNDIDDGDDEEGEDEEDE